MNACVCVNTCLYSVVAIDLIFLECPLPKKHAVGEMVWSECVGTRMRCKKLVF